MSATANQIIKRQSPDRRNIPVDASVHLYEGTIAFVTPAGYASDTHNSGANRFAGVTVHEQDNSAGSAGAIRAEMHAMGIFEFQGTFAQNDVGKDCYALDNFTVGTDRTAGGVRMGVLDEYVSATVGRVRIDANERDELLYTQLAASTAVTTTTAETTLDKSSYTIKGNTLRPGDVLRVRGQVIATATNSTDTLTLKLYLGATAVLATAAVDVANNDIGFFDVDMQVRTVGAGGTFVAAGNEALGTPGTATSKPGNLASTSIDTTADQTVKMTATWSTNNAGNSCRSDVFDVQLLRK
jgi:hypothetical protein